MFGQTRETCLNPPFKLRVESVAVNKA